MCSFRSRLLVNVLNEFQMLLKADVLLLWIKCSVPQRPLPSEELYFEHTQREETTALTHLTVGAGLLENSEMFGWRRRQHRKKRRRREERRGQPCQLMSVCFNKNHTIKTQSSKREQEDVQRRTGEPPEENRRTCRPPWWIPSDVSSSSRILV